MGSLMFDFFFLVLVCIFRPDSSSATRTLTAIVGKDAAVVEICCRWQKRVNDGAMNNNDEQEARESGSGKKNEEIEGRAKTKFRWGGWVGCVFWGAVHAGWPVSVSQSRELTVAKPLPLQPVGVPWGCSVLNFGHRIRLSVFERRSIEIRD